MRWWISYQIVDLNKGAQVLRVGGATLDGSDFLSTIGEFQHLQYESLPQSRHDYKADDLYCQILAVVPLESSRELC